MKKLLAQLMKFGVVGLIAFIIDYSTLYILTEWFGVYYLISSVFAFSLSVIFNYILSIYWVFNVSNKKSLVEAIVFISLSLIGLGINQFIMWFGVEYLRINYLIIKLVSTFVVMVFNFITRKIFLERNK